MLLTILDPRTGTRQTISVPEKPIREGNASK
jgi:hypothetical protein